MYYANPTTLFQKNDKKDNINLQLMNGMNRISILVFLIAIVVMAVRFFWGR